MLRRRRHYPLIALLLLLLATPAQARQSDLEKPIRLSADRAEIDELENVSRYEGNVRITQGTLRISADTVHVTAPARSVKTVQAWGRRATFEQVLDDGRQVHAEAEKMTYDASTHIILLEGDAWLTQGRNEFSSARIEYDIGKERVIAGAPAQGDRVDIIFHPDKSGEDSTGDGASAP
jgi:lipopolysaccharide export system protein LptA